jgi:hypothetical protein
MRLSNYLATLWLAAAVTLGSSPVIDTYGSCGPLARPVCDAAKLKDPVEREKTLRVALQERLLSTDNITRDQVFKYLSENSRWLDLRPYGELLEEFAKLDSRPRGLWLLDEAELAHRARDERIEVFRRAITEGRITLAHGRPITREVAMSFAALTGLTELQGLVEDHKNEVDDVWKRSLKFESFPALFELTAGAADREDAVRRGAMKLASMGDDDFAIRMESDPGFRSAVLQVATDACAPNPLAEQRSPSCLEFREVSKRQVTLQKRRQAALPSKSQEAAREATRVAPTWLDSLRSRVK